MIKALILDIDGTIQNKENDTNLRIIQRIKYLNSKGVKVSFATARAKYMVNELVEKFDLLNQHILEEGGRIYDFNEGRTVLSYYLDKKLVKGLTEYVLNLKDIRVGISSDCFYANYNYHHELSNFLGVTELEYITKLKNYSRVYSLWMRDLSISNMDYLEKLNTNQKANFKKFLQKNGKYSYFVLPTKSTKENGIRFWCKMNNVSLNEVLFVGDDISDVKASEIVGYSATLKNATEKMKETVDFVATSEYDTGVQEIIKKYFNI